MLAVFHKAAASIKLHNNSLIISWIQIEKLMLAENVTEYYGMLRNITECYGMLRNVTECYGMLRNVTEFLSIKPCHFLE